MTQQLEEGDEHIDMIFISDNNPSKVGNPAEGALDYISSPVAIPESVILSIDVAMVFSMGKKKIDSSFPQTFSSRIAVICLVSDHSFRSGLGLPGPCFGTLISPMTLSRSVISAGEAESVWLPRGIPWPSTTTRHFVPFPRLVFPTPAPLFLPGRSSHPQRPHPNRGCRYGPTQRERLATCP